MSDSFLSAYLSYTADSEVPVSFSRWSALTGLAAMLERNAWLVFGNSKIYANQYTMLIGSAGTRKNTAINGIRRTLRSAGLAHFSAQRTTKERFFLDLAGETDGTSEDDNILERNLGFGESSSTHPMNIFVGEANDFFGISNLDFLSILGELWDWDDGPYENRIKNGKSVSIDNPVLNILAGNTPTGFAHAFPPEIIGQGFFSRLLLVYGEPNGKSISFPKTSDPADTAGIVSGLRDCKQHCSGEVHIADSAKTLLSHIYEHTTGLDDPRFDSYFNRRFVHLLKLCIICCANTRIRIVSERIVIEANTYLSYIESLMPKALGEFGKARNSDISHKVLAFITSRDGCSLKDIMKFISADLEKPSDIGDILKKLSVGEKIQSTGSIFLPVRRIGIENSKGNIDLAFLTSEELAVKG